MGDFLVQDYLARSVEVTPNGTAVTDGNRSFTFKELDIISDNMASLLSQAGVSREDSVIYYMKRSPECLIATVAILKSGGAYIPLDSTTPPNRLAQILQDSNASAIICDNSTLEQATKQRDQSANKVLPLISVDERANLEPGGENVYFLDDILSIKPVTLPPRGELDDVAYILYTSGSTGSPKGVMITHRNIQNYIDWACSYFNITADDSILGTAPFYFDMSTFDIFCALASGATLYLATGSKLLFPEHLARYIEENHITIWKGVSSLLMYMCRGSVVQPGRMESLKTVIFAGESLAAQYLAEWMTAYPQVNFYNGFGPTEATGVSLCYHVTEVPEPGQPIPIGKPCKGAQVIVLDENDQPVSPGEIGELCISGECLAKGYMNDPEKTGQVFTPPPPGIDFGTRMYRTGDLVREIPSGDFVFISRKDQQVKWMGYRIELGEIETKLLAHDAVVDAVVLLVEKDEKDLSQLVAFYESKEPLPSQSLSQHLKNNLPHYMIPKKFIHLEQLPKNERGKTARQEILDMYLTDEGHST